MVNEKTLTRGQSNRMPARHSMVRKTLAGMVTAAILAVLPAISQAQSEPRGASIAAKGSAGGALACASCHGAKGEGNAAAGYPRLAGLGAAYLHSQLNHFADGARKSAVMEQVAKQLTAEERKAVSAYFSALTGAAAVAAPDPGKLKTEEAGAWLALRGRWEADLPACVQCHGPGGVGVGDTFPPLAGQSSTYLAAQLVAFKNGTRPGGPMNLMGTVAKKLSDADINAVSRHFGAASQSSTVGSKQ